MVIIITNCYTKKYINKVCYVCGNGNCGQKKTRETDMQGKAGNMMKQRDTTEI